MYQLCSMLTFKVTRWRCRLNACYDKTIEGNLLLPREGRFTVASALTSEASVSFSHLNNLLSSVRKSFLSRAYTIKLTAQFACTISMETMCTFGDTEHSLKFEQKDTYMLIT
ncbi:hypothetical protein OS493_017122 [Desmophyllum pertusum]|uniref:Uncharacterized protein n=1 Tax=Desmophyllum pertusum TaxID=174260 RepID=A0A9X0CED2_9CNID|nr:hypothetical protein OS493_017122 [Desmophyllum pertusum]